MVKIFGKLIYEIYDKICSDFLFVSFLRAKSLIFKLLVLWLFVFSAASYCVKLDLSISSTDGLQIEKAAIGVPFFLKVSVQDLDNLSGLKIEGLDGLNASQVGGDVFSINEYTVLERSFYVKIDKSGKYKIGPAKIQSGQQVYKSNIIELEVCDTDGRFYRGKSPAANYLSSNVEPLPKCDCMADVVGEFICFDASVDRMVARKGDCVVCTLELEGAGDLDSVEIIELQNMPKNLKYYYSKRYLVDNSAKEGMMKKRFEFVVQGLESGELVIPSQKFTFFDTQARRYKTLKSNSINLEILPVINNITKNNNSFDKNNNSKKLENSIHDSLDKKNIMHTDVCSKWHTCKRCKIIFWLILLIFLFVSYLHVNNLSLIVFPEKIKSRLAKSRLAKSRLAKNYFQSRARKKATYKIISSLAIAKNKKDYTSLYAIFITFFSERFLLNESCVTSDKIINILSENSLSQEELLLWESFIEQIMAYAFCDKDRNSSINSEIFSQALSWVDKFKKKFKN